MREYVVWASPDTWWRFSTYAPSVNVRKPRVKVMTRQGEQYFIQRSTAADILWHAREWGWKVEKVA